MGSSNCEKSTKIDLECKPKNQLNLGQTISIIRCYWMGMENQLISTSHNDSYQLKDSS